MKIIALGDTHGRVDWVKVVSNLDFDVLLFLGDYFDTREGISATRQIINFNKIVEYKLNNIDKVILLFGNHDYHYLRNVEDRYSCHQRAYHLEIQEVLHKALDDGLLQMCYMHDNYVFSHAGITKTWLESAGYDDNEPIDEFVNDLFVCRPESFAFTVGTNNSSYGDDITQSPIWVRPDSLNEDRIDNYIQVVGHTTQDTITFMGDKIILIDTMGSSGEFLSIDDGQSSVLNVNYIE